jgi:hypothetical protein
MDNYGLILHVRSDYDLQSRQSYTPSLQFRKHTFFGLLSLQQSLSLSPSPSPLLKHLFLTGKPCLVESTAFLFYFHGVETGHQ